MSELKVFKALPGKRVHAGTSTDVKFNGEGIFATENAREILALRGAKGVEEMEGKEAKEAVESNKKTEEKKAAAKKVKAGMTRKQAEKILNDHGTQFDPKATDEEVVNIAKAVKLAKKDPAADKKKKEEEKREKLISKILETRNGEGDSEEGEKEALEAMTDEELKEQLNLAEEEEEEEEEKKKA